MALDDILTKLQAVRSIMAASVQNKGVAIPDNSTLYTINKGINQIQQGLGDTSLFLSDMLDIIGEDASVPPIIVTGGSKFYKCASVTKALNNTSASLYPTYLLSNPNSSTYSGTYTYIGSFLHSDPDMGANEAGYHLWLNNSYYIMVPPNDLVYLVELIGLDKLNSSFTSYVPVGANGEVVPTDVVKGVETFYIDDFYNGWRWTATKVETPAALPLDVPKTWSGCLLLLLDGVYKVSDTITLNLTYSSVVPKVGGVYTADALIKIATYFNGLPDEGLVFYAPLSYMSNTAETGQSLSYSGTLTYETHEGIPCAYFNGGSYFGVNGLTNSGDLTESVWVKAQDGVDHAYMIVWYQDVSSGRYSLVATENNRYYAPCDGNASNEVSARDIDYYKWHHVCVVRSGNNWSVYVDGQLTETKNLSWNTSSGSTRYYGRTVWTGYNRKNWHGWMAGIRSYNRALSQEEITALSREFTPTGA